MSARGWARRVEGAEGPDRSAAQRVLAQDAVSAAGVRLYGLALVREGLGEARVVAMLGAQGTAGTWATTCLDLRTGRELVVSSSDPDVQARRLRVRDLPEDLYAAWPRDSAGQPLRAGYDDSGRGQTVGPRELRRIALQVAHEPAQGTLFA